MFLFVTINVLLMLYVSRLQLQCCLLLFGTTILMFLVYTNNSNSFTRIELVLRALMLVLGLDSLRFI